MQKIISKITEVSKTFIAITSAIGVIISMLGWITIKVTSIANDFKSAVSVVPIVKAQSIELDYIKNNYILSSTYYKDMNEIKQVYILSEIDFMITASLSRMYKKLPLGASYVNKLVFYRDNLSFLSNQQINNINRIEDAYRKQEVRGDINDVYNEQ